MGFELIVMQIAYLSLLIWICLWLFWGRFWHLEKLKPIQSTTNLDSWPSVWVLIPAKDEAENIAQCLESVLSQNYAGKLNVVLVDDQSADGTAEIARKTAVSLEKTAQFDLISGQSLPPNWKGKLWALQQGINSVQSSLEKTAHQNGKAKSVPEYFLLTDADIQHHPVNLQELVSKAETENLDLVSLMVLLRCQSFWEKLLIPAFVFFFRLLYPFWLANQPGSFVSAAAGGCILIRASTLQKINGFEKIKNALIDDCSLAKQVKSRGGKTWLGLTTETISLRPYDSLQSIWKMVTRTAFNQLGYSWLLLMFTIVGLGLVYLLPWWAIAQGIITNNLELTLLGLAIWGLMSLAYYPLIRLYKISPIWSFLLPAIAFLYSLMTIDSAIKHSQGKGGAWKGRTYDL